MLKAQEQQGYFGEYGGSFVPPQLEATLQNLAERFYEAVEDPQFLSEYQDLMKNYVGRPSALTECHNLSQQLGGGRLFLKREDLNHTGAHKINNTIGQALLARRMGKTRLIAETGAGMHGTATATVAALMGMECRVYMGALDVERQRANVKRMEMLGATVVPVSTGGAVLKDAVDAALAAWLDDPDAFYLLGSAVGPHPYPAMVHAFQSVIGQEARAQMIERTEALPDEVVACVGGGSNAIGIFSAFLDDSQVKLTGVEPAGKGLETDEHAAPLCTGSPAVLHGFRSYVMLDGDEAASAYSISAGLDYPGVGPEHAFLKDAGRASYVAATDAEALSAFRRLCLTEGIIPALESSHALAYALKRLPEMKPHQVLLVNLSGRGDKDMDQIIEGNLLDQY